MASNYTLKYRTFESLFSDCVSDFKKYHDNGLIDPMELIKVARRCNYELGLRIYKTKEIVIDITHGKAKLPDDFYVLNFAMGLGSAKYKQILPQGLHTEDVVVKDPLWKPAPPEDLSGCEPVQTCPPEPEKPCCDQCGEPLCDCDCTCVKIPNSCRMTCNGDVVQVVQRLKHQTLFFNHLFPINIITETEDFNGWCPGMYWQSAHTATIKNGWVYTSFQNGKIYINYQGQMEDDEGNLLVPDHELLNEYYEYALKQRIVENLIMNDEEVNANKIQLIEQRYRAARNNAMSLVNTPNFNELKETFRMNRNAMYNRYYAMFSTIPNFKRN